MYSTTRIRMARKPGAQFQLDDFAQETLNLPVPGAGEVLCQVRYISLDPYLAGMMQSWQGPQRDWSEGIIVGRMVGQVIASNDPNLAEGDWVTGDSRWQGLELARGKNLQKIAVAPGIPGSAYLGVLGSSGLTAWIGINHIIKPQAGETLTISSAAGTVGAIAGQLAKPLGVRVIGIAGGADKCAEVNALGFDDCIDHRAADFAAQLAATVGAGGIQCHYENVGIKTLDPVLGLMTDHGRIGLCGLIAHYLDDAPLCLQHFRKLLVSGLTLRGFRVYDYPHLFAQAQEELTQAVKSGQISLRETLTQGLENAPAAYIAMLNGSGSGKHLIHINP